MRILITTHYFYPENFPVINDLAITLRDQGHQVHIGTGKPNYSGGKLYKNYKLFGFKKEKYVKDINIYRTPILPRKDRKINLLLNYISYIITGSITFPYYLRKHKFDFILHYGAGPMSSIIPSIIMKFQKKTHLVIWVQDLWPETLSSYGFSDKNLLYGLLKFLVKRIYLYSDTILVQSKAFIKPVSKYADREKIFYYPNSFIDFINDSMSNKVKLPDKLIKNLNEYKCFIFAGNLGEAQSLDTIVGAAKILKDHSLCRILFIGSGSKLKWLKREKEKYNIKNIIITGPFSSSQMNEVYSKAYGLIVTLKNEDVFNYTVPSKIQSYLAAGKPIIAALSGEGGKIVTESQSGLVCDSEDVSGLANNIVKLLNTGSVQRKKYGKNGRKFFIENFEMRKKATELIAIMKKRIGYI